MKKITKKKKESNGKKFKLPKFGKNKQPLS